MDGWIIIGALLLLGYLLVVPLIAFIAWQRGNSLERELASFKLVLQDLRKRIAQLEASGPREQPAPVVTVPRASAETVVAPAPIIPVSDPGPATIPVPFQAPAATAASASIPSPAPAATPAPASQTNKPRAAAPRPPVQDSSPNPLSGLVSWFFRGNPIAKLGVVLLFFGIAYLFKYAADRDMFPIELRLAGAAGLSMGLLALGWRLRAKAPLYALVLQGGAIGALYLTTFAAFRLFDMLPHGMSLALLIVICAASIALAVLQRAQSLAVLASAGGYLAPVLLSTGGGSHVALFSYYAMLSLGILAISAWQAWRPLNLTGFFFTFGVALLWGSKNYVPEHYASSQFFLLLNLLIFGLLAVMFSLRNEAEAVEATGRDTAAKHSGLIDGTLVFGTPLVGFGLQYALTKHWQYGPAFSALGFAALYLPLALWIIRRWPEEGRRMAMSLLAVGAGFATLAIPLALSARWTSLAWALEGLGILWAGRTQLQPRMSWSGTALLVLAAVSAGIAWEHGLDTTSFLLIATTLALTWLGAAWLWRDELEEEALPVAKPVANSAATPPASLLLFIGGIAFWLLGLAEGAHRLLPLDESAARMLALTGMALSAWAWHSVGLRKGWALLQSACWLLWPFAALVLVHQCLRDLHPLAAGIWTAAWLLALFVAFYLLRAHDEALTPGPATALHTSLVWGMLLLFASELLWQLNQLPWGTTEWRAAGLMVFCGASLLLLRQLERRNIWPLDTHARSYWLWGMLPLTLVAVLLLFGSNTLDGQMPALAYVPVINPLEEAALFALLMLGVWQRKASDLLARPLLPARMLVLALAAWWANGLLLRTLAAFGDVTWQFNALWDSRLIQTSFALAWTLAALAAMLIAVRHANRSVWFGGAALLGIVIAKLFLVDAARGGGLARAIAFIGVALLILAIGYFAPLPPKKAGQPAQDGATAS